jgi:hypothetical protein
MSLFLRVLALAAGLSMGGGFPDLWSHFLSAETVGTSQIGGEFPEHSACVDPGGGGCVSGS